MSTSENDNGFVVRTGLCPPLRIHSKGYSRRNIGYLCQTDHLQKALPSRWLTATHSNLPHSECSPELSRVYAGSR